jgi:hypothetical protein
MTRLGILALLLGVPVAVSAQECAEIEDSAERLACYDARHATSPGAAEEDAVAPQPANDSPPVPAEAPREAESAAPVAAAVPDEFGKEEPLDTPKEYIEATIAEVSKSGLVYYLHLDNGQVWREVEDSTLRFREGRKVTITEGILGSYDLQMEGQNKIVKVRRVR